LEFESVRALYSENPDEFEQNGTKDPKRTTWKKATGVRKGKASSAAKVYHSNFSGREAGGMGVICFSGWAGTGDRNREEISVSKTALTAGG
jgi:hypothetical protein